MSLQSLSNYFITHEWVACVKKLLIILINRYDYCLTCLTKLLIFKCYLRKKIFVGTAENMFLKDLANYFITHEWTTSHKIIYYHNKLL